jgi:hypothetical protein
MSFKFQMLNPAGAEAERHRNTRATSAEVLFM